jgi:formate--tetrahydrofolate ligase
MIERQPTGFRYLYDDATPLWDKVKTVATELYGADDIIADQKVRDQFAKLQEDFGELPVCIAKTPMSFSTDPDLRGAPTGHVVPIREVRLSAGAGFVVVICGNIMTMPGLPRVPTAEKIFVNKAGHIEGLF